jgi:multidrug efflux system membrane fusion protein
MMKDKTQMPIEMASLTKLRIANCGLRIQEQQQVRGRGSLAFNPQSAIRNPQSFLIGISCFIILQALAGCSGKSEGGPPRKGEDSAPVPVTVAPVVQKMAEVDLKNIGTVEANATVGVKSQVTAALDKVHFKEGQEVKEGDLLFTLDPRPYEAALRQAEANLERNRTLLKNAQKESDRQSELYKKGFTAQDTFDLARVAAEALVSTISADQAAIDTAKINLSYCTIRSPLQGRTGDYMVDRGNLVKANDVTLVVINQVRPIKVTFSLPQADLPEIQRQMSRGKLQVGACIPGEEDQPETGELVFVNNTVDQPTGTIQLKGLFANIQERLWPGQYVNVTLVLSKQPDAIIIPSRAIQVGQKGQYVFVLKADSTVEDRPITVDRTIGEESVISKGLSPGEQVVTDGQLRLTPGAKVVVKTSLEAAATAAAKGAAADSAEKKPAEKAPAGKASPEKAPAEKPPEGQGPRQ